MYNGSHAIDNNRYLGGLRSQNVIDETNNILVRKRIKNAENIGCGIILLDKDDKIILGTRTDLPEGVYERMIKNGEEFKWTIPGGGLENNECPLFGAMRELEEEFGIKAGKQTTQVETIGYHDYYYVRDNVIRNRRDFAFVTKLKWNTTIEDIKPQLGEIGEVKSFSKKEIVDMIKHEKIYRASRTSLLMAIKMGKL